jgi:hypothetical protein
MANNCYVLENEIAHKLGMTWKPKGIGRFYVAPTPGNSSSTRWQSTVLKID